ncbi:MAG: hypothetical protein C5B50_15965 [Verrucomicrobia bacterium]|nr:MAG: hypothetical protein C5B50_15965 [Verrucomicrobiota bacterium]
MQGGWGTMGQTGLLGQFNDFDVRGRPRLAGEGKSIGRFKVQSSRFKVQSPKPKGPKARVRSQWAAAQFDKVMDEVEDKVPEMPGGVGGIILSLGRLSFTELG